MHHGKGLEASHAFIFAQPRRGPSSGAVAYANERKHEYATLEHLLLALIDDQRRRRA